MMVDLKVMAYFKISLSTRNWDRAINFPLFHCICRSLTIYLPNDSVLSRGQTD
jgi:hypothetical protein